jgi:hypothetical protein
MPTTSVRRLISPLSRSSGLMEWIFGPVIFREAHEGQYVGLRFVHEGSELRHLRGFVNERGLSECARPAESDSLTNYFLGGRA